MLKPGERAALQFSGGKDSRALLELARPHLAQITVFFADTGAIVPHVRDYVEETCRQLGAKLEVVLPPVHVKAHTDAAGLPADIVPVERTLAFQPFLRTRKPQLLQSYMDCCGAMIFQPLEQAIRSHGFTLVLRGSKRSDARVGVGPSHWQNGVEYRSPLWNYSDAEVLALLDSHRVKLPEHYAEVPDSLDCWLCTAHLGHHGIRKLLYLRRRYPDLWPELAERLERVKQALIFEQHAIQRALDVAGEP